MQSAGDYGSKNFAGEQGLAGNIILPICIKLPIKKSKKQKKCEFMFTVAYTLSFSNVYGRLSEITWQNMFSRCWNEVILPLCSVPAEAHPGVLGSGLGSQCRTDVVVSEGVQWRGTKMNNILKHLTWAEGGRDSSAWRRPGSGSSYQCWFNLINRGIEKLKPDSSQWPSETRKEAMGMDWNSGNST